MDSSTSTLESKTIISAEIKPPSRFQRRRHVVFLIHCLIPSVEAVCNEERRETSHGCGWYSPIQFWVIQIGTVLHQGSSCVLKSGSAIKVSRSMFYFMLPKVVLETDPIIADGSQSNKIIPKVKGNVLSIKRVCESQQEDEIQKVKVWNQ